MAAMIEPALDRFAGSELQARDGSHFRAIRAALKQTDAADAALIDAVCAARAAGDSWTVIADALGVTRQAAHRRFARHTNDVP